MSNNGEILDKHANYDDKGIFFKNVDKCDKNSRVHGTEEQYCWKSLSERFFSCFFKLLSVKEHLKLHIEIHLYLSI